MKKKVKRARNRLRNLSRAYIILLLAKELFRLSSQNWSNWGWSIPIFIFIGILFNNFADGTLNTKSIMYYYGAFSVVAILLVFANAQPLQVHNYIQMGMLLIVVTMILLRDFEPHTKEYMEIQRKHWEKYNTMNKVAFEKMKEKKRQQ